MLIFGHFSLIWTVLEHFWATFDHLGLAHVSPTTSTSTTIRFSLKSCSREQKWNELTCSFRFKVFPSKSCFSPKINFLCPKTLAKTTNVLGHFWWDTSDAWLWLCDAVTSWFERFLCCRFSISVHLYPVTTTTTSTRPSTYARTKLKLYIFVS